MYLLGLHLLDIVQRERWCFEVHQRQPFSLPHKHAHTMTAPGIDLPYQKVGISRLYIMFLCSQLTSKHLKLV